MNGRRSVIAIALFAVLAACRGGNGGPSGTARLVIADPREPNSLNQLLLEGPASTTIVPLVYSFLVTMDDRGNLQPDVAAEVPSLANGGISRDGRTITYHLRRNVKWQDGAPLTARDVAFTYAQIMNRRNNVQTRYGYDRVLSVTAVDPYSVRAVLRTPYSPIVSTFFGPNENYGILPEHLLHGYANLNQIPFNAQPIGSGPFRVKEWMRGDHLTLVRNPAYFRGSPGLDEITLRFIANSNTILNQLRTNEVNAYFFADAVHLREYSGIPRLRVSRAPFAGFGDLLFNVASPRVSDVRTRQAIVEALDLPEIVRKATRATQTIDAANRGLFDWGYDSAVPQPVYDPTAAKRMLDARRPLSLTYAFESGIAASASVGVQLQQQLHDAGVDVTLRAYTPQMFRAPAAAGGPMFGGNFDIAFYEIFTTADPDVQWYLSCSQIPPAGFNLSRFCDTATDHAIDEGLATYDPAARRKFASIVQRRVADLVPFVALWADNAIYVTPAALRGFRPSATSPYWNVWAWSLR